MSSLKFIFEKPQKAPNATKKRTRLITACDSCRTRKLKCGPSKCGKDICESCSQSGIDCKFTERDHIRAQRGIASFSVNAEKAGKVKATKNSQLVTRMELPVVPRSEPHRKHEPSFSIPRLDFVSGGPIPPPGTSSNHFNIASGWDVVTSRTAHLFDPARHDYPHPQLLPQLTIIFFEYTRGIFNFFDEGELLEKAYSSTLSGLLANCIAAYAIRFYDNFPHSPGARHLSSAPFVDTAKSLISEITLSKLELVQCLILLSWIENGTGATESKLWGLFSYDDEFAATVALDLKLDSEESILLDPSPKSRDRKRRTFWAVAWLDLISCSVVSRTPLINLDNCTTSMPCPEISSVGSLSRHHVYETLRSMFITMAKLYAVSNAGKPSVPSASRDLGLLRLQQVMLEFRDKLPQTMAFNIENLRYADELREGYYFHLTHALVHSMVVALHCPALFWASQSGSGTPPLSRMDVAWPSILQLLDIYVLMGRIDHRMPVAINSLSVPLGMARGALMLAQTHRLHTMSSVGMSEDVFSRTSQLYLSESLRLLMDLSTYWISISQVKIASEPVALYDSNLRRDSGMILEQKDHISSRRSFGHSNFLDTQGYSWDNTTASARILHGDLQLEAAMYKGIPIADAQEADDTPSSSGALVRHQALGPNGLFNSPV